MSDIALYRKYRPKTFSEVLGQDHIVKVLESSAKKGDIGHSYIFTGTRGTGKTTLARIFAREIGCSPNDVFEIDAASNTSVDDIRELREAVASRPLEGKYKTYILDEVHMLSKNAWNAFLKTLEEPPAHAVFIMATTEFRKIPNTVASRCQTFHFKKPSRQLLKDIVLDTAKKEKREMDAPSAETIALLGDGSFRDTLVVLQKVLSSVSSKKVSAADTEKVTGVPRSTLVNDFLSALNAKDAPKSFAALHSASEEDADIELFLKLSVMKLRAAMMLRIAPEMKERIRPDFTDEDFAFLSTLPPNKDIRLSEVLSILLGALSETKHSFLPALPSELAIAKLFSNE